MSNRSEGRATLALYDEAPLRHRAHVHVRWRTCPFGAVAGHVPVRGDVLEVGCGHGLLAAHLALGSSQRRVVGVDVDREKVAIAQLAARRARASGADLTVETIDARSPLRLPAGPWDAIALVDVLYLLAPDAQRELLDVCARALDPGGTLLVKEMAARPRWKHRWNVVQETVAVRAVGLTAGDGVHVLDPATHAGWLERAGLVVRSRPLHRHSVHPHHLLVASRPR